MKKHMLILAGSAMILASCGSNNNENQQNEQAKMDSIAKANAALQEEINHKKNDSTINAMAAARADSMANATKEEETKKAGTKKTKTKTTTTTTTVKEGPTPAPVKVQGAITVPAGMKGHSDQSQNSSNTNTKQGGGLKGHSDQTH